MNNLLTKAHTVSNRCQVFHSSLFETCWHIPVHLLGCPGGSASVHLLNYHLNWCICSHPSALKFVNKAVISQSISHVSILFTPSHAFSFLLYSKPPSLQWCKRPYLISMLLNATLDHQRHVSPFICVSIFYFSFFCCYSNSILLFF